MYKMEINKRGWRGGGVILIGLIVAQVHTTALDRIVSTLPLKQRILKILSWNI